MFNACLLAQAPLPEVSIGAWGTVVIVLLGLVFSAQALTNVLIRWGILKDKSLTRDASELYATKQEIARVDLEIQHTKQEIKALERETEEGRRRLYDELRATVNGFNSVIRDLSETIGELKGIYKK